VIGPHDQGSGESRPAGPVGEEGEALRAGSSSTSPSSPPPAGGTSEAEGSGGADQADQVEQDFDALLADTQRERDEYLDLAQRTKADFENFRRRMTAEVQAASVRGKAALAREVIDAVDNLERALAARGERPDDLAAGVEMVLRGLRETLSRHGVEAIDPAGEKFDPTLHEALSTVALEGAEPGTVAEVLQKGYKLDQQLIRPARVVVSE
jgi:molecular chaperone GrpE